MVNGSAFLIQKEREKKLKDLSEKYAYESLLQLSSDLKIDAESYLRIAAGLQGITPKLGKRIDYLWIEKFGTVYHPAPKSVLDMEIEIETIEKSSAFFYRDPMIGIKDEYKDIVFWDILTEQINELEYIKDNPLFRVRKKIIPVLDKFYKTLYVSPTEYISEATLFGPERRKNRTFELHIIDTETKSVQYSLAYSQGDLQVSDGNIQADIIAYILRTEGYWE